MRSPAGSKASPIGSLKVASAAGPPSPDRLPAIRPVGPLPAIVVMMPVASIRRMR